MISGFQALRKARSLMAGLKPVTEGPLQILRQEVRKETTREEEGEGREKAEDRKWGRRSERDSRVQELWARLFSKSGSNVKKNFIPCPIQCVGGIVDSESDLRSAGTLIVIRGVSGTGDRESTLRSAGTLLSCVRAPPPA
ncbi:hypothetical protein PoB_007206200 [Plakobranchus ocellatus]|uniref:Uncharacterized protein n=1 Tax=Plakobranchus ocellatus TaxID=259542 RepID=A0AAV4DMM1_9GAST|nr:hypothetical protein PoB_007206200 [Plakobranchus ocellatus]